MFQQEKGKVYRHDKYSYSYNPISNDEQLNRGNIVVKYIRLKLAGLLTTTSKGVNILLQTTIRRFTQHVLNKQANQTKQVPLLGELASGLIAVYLAFSLARILPANVQHAFYSIMRHNASCKFKSQNLM